MSRKFRKGMKILGLLLFLTGVTFAVFMITGIIWRSPAYYNVREIRNFEKPIMSMAEYEENRKHVRPYIFHLENQTGEVYVLGIDHTKDAKNPQMDSITRIWNEFQPDVLLVEGRLGFLFELFQDPVEVYGESGKALSLAKKDGVEFFTWEPNKQDEVDMMLQYYSPEKVAFFYSLRPYLSNFRFGKPGNPEEVMQKYIDSRTDQDGIRGSIKSVSQMDSIWSKDYPNEKDWRDSSDQYGWPSGYLSEMAGYSNQVRDLHMCSAILELTEQGKKVFVTMGSSHAFRIEETLKHEFAKTAVPKRD